MKLPKYILTFILSSILAIALSYFKLQFSNIQHITTLIIVILLLTVNFLQNKKSQLLSSDASRLLLVFFSSLLTQNLVLSTGGFLSPLLILIHLYVLGTAFLISSNAAFSFMALAILALSVNSGIDPVARKLLLQDAFSVLVYAISFIVVIPLGIYLSRIYGLKDLVTKVLHQQIKLGSIREQSIISGLSEFVVVTDLNLLIISANDAVRKLTDRADSQIIGHHLLEVLRFVSGYGIPVSSSSWPLDSVIYKHLVQVINDQYLFIRSSIPTHVSIQIRPIQNLDGGVHQLAFFISDKRLNPDHELSYLEQARSKNQALKIDLENSIKGLNNLKLLQKIELINKHEENFITAFEIENNPIKANLTLRNIRSLVEKTVLSETEFANLFYTSLHISIPSPDNLISLVAPVDVRWFDILVTNLLDLGILLTSSFPFKKVEIFFENSDQSVTVIFRILLPTSSLELSPEDLLRPHYSESGLRTNLQLGSGIEGVIAKKIADNLNIQLLTKKGTDFLEIVTILDKNHPV